MSFIQLQLQAQTGNLKGSVKDKVTGEGLIDVNVFVPKANTGALTELEGEFFIPDIPAGTYKVIFNADGYKSDTLSNIVITSGQTTELNHTLVSDTANAVTVYVIGQKNEGSIQTAVEDTKNSEKVISVLSAEQILKGQDRDAAEAVRRIPGVTLIDGRFIMVRGLAERYNSVWLNDAGAPSSETDTKAFSFDIIPSQLIDKIQVYKTAAPDLPGDFAGGMVKVYTRASAQKKDLQIYAQQSFRPGSTFNNFNFTAGSPTDFLGFDNGFRALPSNIPSYNLNANPNLDRNAISKSFVNDWGGHGRKALPDSRLNIYFTNRFNLGNVKVGSTSNLNYAYLNTVYKIHRADYDSLSKIADYSDVQNGNTARLGLIQNFSFTFSKNFKLEFRNLFNQFGYNQNTLRTSNLANIPDSKSYELLYQSRTIYSSQLGGTLTSDNGKTEYTATIGYSYNQRNLPDLKRIKYTKLKGAPDSEYTAQVPPGTADPVNGGGRYFINLKENVQSFNHNFKRDFGGTDNFNFTLNVGNYVELKSREFSARIFGYTIPPSANSQQYVKLPVDQIFSTQHTGAGGFKLDEITSKSDAYSAQNHLIATYASGYFELWKKLKVLGGARAEYNVQSLQGYVNQSRITPDVKTFFVLPSVNASYNFTEKSLLRVAYGKTLNRPEFREWSPFYFYDFDFNAGTYGSLFPTVINPKGVILKVATIQNFDLRYELYPGSGELINIGVFYKDFTNPIQRVVRSASDDGRAFTFANAQSAYATGIELDVRKNLGFLSNVVNTSFFNDLSLVMNASLIKSQVYNDNVINQATKSALQGQSPYIINAGLYYQNDSTGWQGSMIYNVYGPSLYLFGTLTYPSWGMMPRNSLDLTISKSISKKVTIVLGIQDILNQKVLIVQDTNNNGKFERHKDNEIMSFRRGSYYTLGLKYNVF